MLILVWYRVAGLLTRPDWVQIKCLFRHDLGPEQSIKGQTEDPGTKSGEFKTVQTNAMTL